MKITLLGTGTSQGVPMIGCNCEVCTSPDPKDNRLRSSLLIQTEELTIVIDTGPDFRMQMLNAGIKKIDAVLYTHEHRDHIAGLDDIRAFNYLQQKPIDLYMENRVSQAFLSEFKYIFSADNYPGIPKVNMNIIENKPFTIKGLTIIPIRIMHCKLPVFGFRIGDFAYITDANYIADEEKKKLLGCKCLVINGLQQETHPSHFSLTEAVEVARLINPDNTYITHISHRMGKHAEVNKTLPQNIQLAYDGLSFTL